VSLLVGVDTGGTFTDFVVGERAFKVRSTPADPAAAVLDGLARIPADHGAVVHGTTVATNALLTGNLARVAFVTTRGIEDLLEIGRQDRRDLYALEPRPHDPLVAPADRHGVVERVRADGSVETPLDLADLVARLEAGGAEAVAVCLLHSYRNPEHEREIGAAVSRWPVSLSHRVANEFREFERAATTVANAALLPVLAPYVERLSHLDVSILQSNGGTATCAEVAEFPIRTVLSGPAGGVVAAAALARRHGIGEAVSFDMGGTSTDVSFIRGEPARANEFELNGLPLRVPVLDVHTVGAGGGSIAHLDALGALRVGPQSAGAVPGPACYGDGEQATVTDAHVVRGHLGAEQPLAGTLALDVARAHRYVGDRAAGILRVADATMERAIRNVTVRRGIDPRQCVLIAFGGAGPLHACSLADLLGMRAVMIPPQPGTFSAHGMRSADRRRDFVRTVLDDAAACVPRLDALFSEFPPVDAPVLTRTADVRYAGQSHELSVAADGDLVAHFHAAHERAYGYRDESRAVEVVNLRLAAIDPAPPEPPVAPIERRTWPAGPARLRRDQLEGGVAGPCVIDEDTATTVVAAGWQASRCRDGALYLERNA